MGDEIVCEMIAQMNAASDPGGGLQVMLFWVHLNHGFGDRPKDVG